MVQAASCMLVLFKGSRGGWDVSDLEGTDMTHTCRLTEKHGNVTWCELKERQACFIRLISAFFTCMLFPSGRTLGTLQFCLNVSGSELQNLIHKTVKMHDEVVPVNLIPRNNNAFLTFLDELLWCHVT